MRYIAKQNIDPELKILLENALKGNLKWEEFKQGKKALRLHLYNEQQGLCAYSEISLDMFGFHIDHIKPKGNKKFAHLRFTPTNLLASAIDDRSRIEKKLDLFGGHKKLEDEIPIDPTQANCAHYFQYNPNGKIQANSTLSEAEQLQAEQTITCLGLCCQLLINKRKDLYKKLNQELSYLLDDDVALDEYINAYLSVDEFGKLKPFQSLARQIFNKPACNGGK